MSCVRSEWKGERESVNAEECESVRGSMGEEHSEDNIRRWSEARMHEPNTREVETNIQRVAFGAMFMAEECEHDDGSSVNQEVEELPVLSQAL